MSPRKGSGKGMNKTSKGYLRICRRGPLRNMMAHRAYVNRQLAECGRPPLRDDQEVHHLCRNRACWPPTDFHLLVLDVALHHAFETGTRPWGAHYAKGVADGTYEKVSTSDEIVLDNEIARD